MKNLAIISLLTATAALASSIDWGSSKDRALYSFKRHDPLKTVEFGLRSDGVVVWREITAAQSVTNSPAEDDEIHARTLVITNSIWGTNVFIITNQTLPWRYTPSQFPNTIDLNAAH